MLKVWNACLVVGSFSLALLGTFLVRSGVLQSIHAFGDNTVGPYILGLIAVVLIGSTALIVSRLDDLRSPKRIDSLVSREAVFLVNNLLLVALTAVIFWGTFFPLISELFTGEQGLAGGALVRPLHDAAGDPARPLHRDRAAAGLAPGQLGLGQAGLPGAGDRRRRRRGGAGAVQRRHPQALGVRPLRLRRLRPDRAGAGVLARGRGAAQARRRLDAGGAGRRRLPQPPPLRRLHRPHRHRRAADRHRRLLQLPDQPRRHPEAGAEHRGRRPQDHLREADRRGRRPSTSSSAATCGSRRAASWSRRCTRAGATSARPARQTGTIGSFFDGESTSEVGLKAGLGSDLWIAAAAGHQPPCSGGCGRPTRASAPASAAPPARRRSATRWRR